MKSLEPIAHLIDPVHRNFVRSDGLSRGRPGSAPLVSIRLPAARQGA